MSISNTKKADKTTRLVTLAILTALIIILQIVSNFIRFGPVQITLALTPVIIGAALYGMWAGAFLGTALGVVILIWGLCGLDGGFVLALMSVNPVMGVALAVFKTTFAGLAAGAIYAALSKKNDLAASFIAGALCPIVNTGIFISVMFTVFFDVLSNYYSLYGEGKTIFAFTISTFVGINFIVELVVNMVLATAVTRIIRIAKKK
ncbi:MAG: ECF transporter S component [Clostridia bacterium]|nr:ECF transporter S component [Clostridia bacterium]